MEHFLQTDESLGAVKSVVLELVDDQLFPFRPWLLAFEGRRRRVADIVGQDTDRKRRMHFHGHGE